VVLLRAGGEEVGEELAVVEGFDYRVEGGLVALVVAFS
jgi:hypothetical protein